MIISSTVTLQARHAKDSKHYQYHNQRHRNTCNTHPCLSWSYVISDLSLVYLSSWRHTRFKNIGNMSVQKINGWLTQNIEMGGRGKRERNKAKKGDRVYISFNRYKSMSLSLSLPQPRLNTVILLSKIRSVPSFLTLIYLPVP